MKTITTTKLPTVKDYIDAYLIERKYCAAPSTLASDLSRAKNINEALGEFPINAVSHTQINMLLVSWHERFRNKTINEHLTILRRISLKAVRDGVIARNPMNGVQNFKTVDPEPNPFTKKELARMHECKNVCTQGQNAVMLNLLTGLRISELIALSWQDINWEREVLYVRRACVLNIYKCPKTKGSVREVDLNPLALKLLKEQLKLTGKRRPQTINILECDNKTFTKDSVSFIFLNTKTNQPFTDAKEFTERFFIKFLEQAGVAHRGVGQLRHTFASQCLTAGISKDWLAVQMGHKSTTMIDKHYGRWIREDSPNYAREAAQHLEEIFGLPQIKPTVTLPAVPHSSLVLLKKLQSKPQLIQLLEGMLESDR